MREALLDRVQALAARFGHLGVQYDLACLTLAGSWGLRNLLERLLRSVGNGPAA
jgi:hypothetical protein